MDKEVAFKWADELESGKWIQAHGALKRQKDHEKPRYCCLGVLCEIQGLKSKLVSKNNYAYDNNYSFIPFSLSEKLNLSDKTQSTLSMLNDSGKDFKYIAEYIRQNYKNL